MRRRGKIIALSSAAVGIVVLVAAGVVGKDWMREEYYAWRLSWGNAAEKQQSAGRLLELNPNRAITVICREVGEIIDSDLDCAQMLMNWIVASQVDLFPDLRRVYQVDGWPISATSDSDIFYALRTISGSNVFAQDARQAAAATLAKLVSR